MSNPATRLITLIMLMQRRPNQKAAQLARELGISIRTLHRYFEMLEEMGIPIYTERGPYGGFSLVRGYKMPPLALTPEEAVAVTLGTSLVPELWGQLYQQAATGALAKLDQLLPEEQRAEAAWARRSLVALGLRNQSLDEQYPTLEKLRQANRELRSVEMVYASASSPIPGKRKFDPYVLALRWGWWYVAGFCHKRKEVRTFRVDRIKGLSILEAGFKIPEDFDARDLLSRDFQGQPQVQIKLEFPAKEAHQVRLNPTNWESIIENPDGSMTVTMSAPDLNWAMRSVLYFGMSVTVLEPAELCSLIRQTATELADLYDTRD